MSRPFHLSDQTKFPRLGGQPHVGVVRAQQQPVFRPAGEHPVGFVRALRHQIIDQHADVGFGPAQDELPLVPRLPRRVDPGHDPLGGGLLVTATFR